MKRVITLWGIPIQDETRRSWFCACTDQCDKCRRKYECWTGNGIDVQWKEIDDFHGNGIKHAVYKLLGVMPS